MTQRPLDWWAKQVLLRRLSIAWGGRGTRKVDDPYAQFERVRFSVKIWKFSALNSASTPNFEMYISAVRYTCGTPVTIP